MKVNRQIVILVVAFLVAALATFCVYAIVAKFPNSHSGMYKPLGMTDAGFWLFLILWMLIPTVGSKFLQPQKASYAASSMFFVGYAFFNLLFVHWQSSWRLPIFCCLLAPGSLGLAFLIFGSIRDWNRERISRSQLVEDAARQGNTPGNS
jgi:hypothetical protein